jgi:hypothetical protein
MRCRQVFFLLLSCVFLDAAASGCSSLLGDFTVGTEGTDAGDASTSGDDATVDGAANGGDGAVSPDANGDDGTVSADGTTRADGGDGGGADAIATADVAAGDGGKHQGDPCSASSECGSAGGCVDGFCCDTTCADSCHACNLMGSAGTCSPIPSGSAPATGHAACPADAKSTCQHDGTCDGKGACRLWPLSTPCKGSACDMTSNKFTAASTCDGMGTCATPSAITCSPFVCQDTSQCFATCTATNKECVSGNACVNGSCGLKPDGATCAADAECVHAHCADKVCCDQACGGTCQTCNQASTLGACKSVAAGQDPRGVCPAGSGANAVCQPGKCNGANQCNTAMPGTACTNAMCSGGTATAAGTCDANGNCQVPAGAPCSPYLCGASTCKKPCGTDADCVTGYYCSAGACLAQKSQGGSPCARDGECQSGLSCSLEGICCNSPCTGACQVCNSAGMCSPTPANSQPRAGHGTCTGAGASPCGGYCDGVDIGCFYPTTQCSGPSCGCYPAGGCHSAPAVNCSNGTCPNAVLVSCNGFNCNTAMTACNQVCDPINDTGCYPFGPGASCCHTVFTGVCFHNCTTTCPASGTCM